MYYEFKMVDPALRKLHTEANQGEIFKVESFQLVKDERLNPLKPIPFWIFTSNPGARARTARGDTARPVEGERSHREDGEGRLHHLPQGGGPAQYDVRCAQGEGGASAEDASGKR